MPRSKTAAAPAEFDLGKAKGSLPAAECTVVDESNWKFVFNDDVSRTQIVLNISLRKGRLFLAVDVHSASGRPAIHVEYWKMASVSYDVTDHNLRFYFRNLGNARDKCHFVRIGNDGSFFSTVE